jgi:beta-glucosidase
MTIARLVELVKQLTLEEKCNLLSGKDAWRTYDVPRLGIPSLKVSELDIDGANWQFSDGPNGARGDTFIGVGCFV